MIICACSYSLVRSAGSVLAAAWRISASNAGLHHF